MDQADPRWSLANERTLLAYIRTALSMLVAGLAIAGSHTVTDAPAWLAALGLPLIALGIAISIEGRSRFFATQRAMESGEPVAAPVVAAALSWSMAAFGAVGLVLAVIAVVVS